MDQLATLRAHASAVLGALVDATGAEGTLTIEPGGVTLTHPACGRVVFLLGENILHIASKSGTLFTGPHDVLIANISLATLLSRQRR